MRSIWIDDKSWDRKWSKTAVGLETEAVDPSTGSQFSSKWSLSRTLVSLMYRL